MNHKVLIVAEVIVGCIMAVGVGIYIFAPSGGQISIENRSSEVIDRASIDVCGKTIDFSGIAPGETKTGKYDVTVDSNYGVTINFHSGRILGAQTGHVTKGESYKDALIIQNNAILLRPNSALSL